MLLDCLTVRCSKHSGDPMRDDDFVEYSDGDSARRISIRGLAYYAALYSVAGVLMFGAVQAAAWFVISLVYAMAGL